MMADRSEDQGARPLAGDSSGSGRVARDAEAHTPEPWTIEDKRGSGGGPWDRLIALSGTAGRDDVVICEFNRGLAESDANALRIVICINACAGLAHPEYLPELIGACALAEFDRGVDGPIRAALAKLFDKAG